MTTEIKIAFAQLNAMPGDIGGNVGRLMVAWREAARKGADLLIAPELFLIGGPVGDLAARNTLLKTIHDTVLSLARDTATGPSVLVGAPWEEEGKIYNAALFLDEGTIATKFYKTGEMKASLPSEEGVYARSGNPLVPMIWRDKRFGVVLGEDLGSPSLIEHYAKKGTDIFLVLAAAPYEEGAREARFMKAQACATASNAPLVFVNGVGGYDEAVLDGSSFAMSAEGVLKMQAPAWGESILVVTCSFEDAPAGIEASKETLPVAEGVEADYEALLLGLRDYARKNAYSNIVVGVSGEVDDALVSMLAVDALGPDAVRTVLLTTSTISTENIADASAMAKALGCRFDAIPIASSIQSFEYALSEAFMGCEPDVTEERLHSRCRSVLLMALANKNGALPLSCVNKSELATGTVALYGDMCGLYAPLKDVYKSRAYELASWRNTAKPSSALGPSGTFVVERILTKAPKADILVDEKDKEGFPPFNVLDPILVGLIEHKRTIAELAEAKHDPDLVRKIAMLVDKAEYIRRQSPPGPKITRCHLTLDRRLPITKKPIDR